MFGRTYHPFFELNRDIRTLDESRLSDDDKKYIEDAKKRIKTVTALATVGGWCAARVIAPAIYVKTRAFIRPASLIAAGFIGWNTGDYMIKTEFVKAKENLPKDSYFRHFLVDVIQPYWNYYYKGGKRNEGYYGIANRNQ